MEKLTGGITNQSRNGEQEQRVIGRNNRAEVVKHTRISQSTWRQPIVNVPDIKIGR